MNKVKQILKDIFIIYKNIIAWNISKLNIFLIALFLVFVVIIFFIIITYFIHIYDPINWKLIYEKLISSSSGINNSIYLIFKEHIFFSFIYFILLISFISTLIITFNYSNFLLAKLHLNYIRWKKYFNFLDNKKNFIKNFFKYFSITINFILYLTLPLLLFIFGYFIILLIYPDSQRISQVFSTFTINDSFSFWIISISIISIFYFIYIFYRIIFSYVILADNENYIDKLKYSFYIKESIKLTKSFKNFFIFLLLFFILLIITSPIIKVWENLKNSLINNIELINSQEKFFPYLQTKEIKIPKNIDFLKIRKNTNKNIILYTFYLIIYFILIAWLFNLFIVSFYERFLLINRINILQEKYKTWNFLVKKKIKVKKIKK